MPRHEDQVCSTNARPPAAMRISELFDTAGLAATLSDAVVPPHPMTPPWPHYDFIIRYDTRGAPVASGTWDTTVEPPLAHALEAELRRRILPLPGLLEPTGFRTRVVFAPRITFDLAGPVECMPHIRHLPGERALGLPPAVTTWTGRAYVREDDPDAAVVRIHVGPDGRVTRIDAVRGGPAPVAEARRVIPLLRFDPALHNGVPVGGQLVQSFRFRWSGG
ncbi:MAG: energy transducer TonB [Gemmatimonadota bacterium]